MVGSLGARGYMGSMTVRKILLACGALSSPLYIATDVLAIRRYKRYRYASQWVSELMATGAPTRSLLIKRFTPYNLLVAGFARGVWASDVRRRTSRIAALSLIGYAAVGEATLLFFPMDQRGAEVTRHGKIHGPMTFVMSIFILLAMGFGATLGGRRFRAYSFGTMLALAVFGGWTGLDVPLVAAGKPTPWTGVKERVNIYATMLWIVVLASSLWPTTGNSVEIPLAVSPVS